MLINTHSKYSHLTRILPNYWYFHLQIIQRKLCLFVKDKCKGKSVPLFMDMKFYVRYTLQFMLHKYSYLTWIEAINIHNIKFAQHGVLQSTAINWEICARFGFLADNFVNSLKFETTDLIVSILRASLYSEGISLFIFEIFSFHWK